MPANECDELLADLIKVATHAQHRREGQADRTSTTGGALAGSDPLPGIDTARDGTSAPTGSYTGAEGNSYSGAVGGSA